LSKPALDAPDPTAPQLRQIRGAGSPWTVPRGEWLIDGSDYEWQDRAACRGADTDLFFPERGESTKTAKATCAQCDVRSACLDFAIAHRIKFGVWGGMSDRQRRQVMRERGA